MLPGMPHLPASSGAETGAPMLVRLPPVWLREVIFLAVFAVAAVYGLVSRTAHPGHQRVPIPAQLAIAAVIIVVVGGFVVLKGRRAGIEIRTDGIIIRRCWLPDRRLSRDEVRGYLLVHQRLGVAGSIRLTYFALSLSSGSYAKTLGAAIMNMSPGRTSAKSRRRLENAAEQLRQLGIRHDPAKPVSSLAMAFRRARPHDRVPHSDASP
jgi:hypothetical protein